jgi:phosphohistidine phosphatase
MNLYLIQHGKPVPKDQDPARPLSPEGEEDARRVGAFLRSAQVAVGNVFHSGKQRAQQTAEIVCAEMKMGGMPRERAGLRPMDSVEVIAHEVQGQKEDLMVVGHLPHLSKLASFLVTGEETPPVVQFQQGAVVCLRPAEEEGGWGIAWMVVPELLHT